jgi:fibronectin-binding autotransporter adhesin
VITGAGGLTLGASSTNKLTLSGAVNYAGPTTVNGGTLAITQGFKNGNSLTVADGAKAVVPGAAVNAYDGGAVIPSGSNATGSLISSLNLNATGQLDLGNSDMAINHDGSLSIATIAALVASGYNGGTWDGPGIVASSANLDSTVFGLGYAENGDPEAIPPTTARTTSSSASPWTRPVCC